MKNLIFTLDAKEEIIIQLESSAFEMVGCDEIPIYFKNEKKYYLIRDDFIRESLVILVSLLRKTLDNKLLLHYSITENIGLMWNKVLHNEQGFVYYENDEGYSFWVGLRNSLWETPGNIDPKLSTWLYNDKNGNIIFEITPNYPWHHVDPEPNEKFISYEEFMKNYKPLLIRTIPHDVAIKWIAQAEILLKLIQENEKMFEINDSNKIKNSC